MTSSIISYTNVILDFLMHSVYNYHILTKEGDMVLAMDNFLTTDEVAAKMRVSRNTVIQLIDRNELPATRFGRQYRIKEADLIDYINRNYNR
jgi:excisionase family DNA binding protein